MRWPWRKKEVVESQSQSTKNLMNSGYSAATISNLTAGWTTESRHPDELIKSQLKILRARSREQFRNNDYMSRFVGLLKSNVVGPNGVMFQAQAKDNRGALDTLDNNAIEKDFKEWRRRGNCDVSRQLSFKDCEKLFISSVGIDGEFLAREVRLPEYRLDLIDTELLDVEHNREQLPNGHFIRFSIEFDSNRAPVAYYILDNASQDTYQWNGKTYKRYPAEDIIHCFIPEMVGQKRGFPMASTALMRMNMLDGYEDAAITAARVGAAKMGFFTSETGEGYTGDGTDADGNVVTDVEAGVFEQLPDGMDFTPFNPDYPHQQFPDFVKSCLRGVSSGLNVSYNSISNDLEGVNYSSIRAGVLEDREVWKALQEWMIECFNYRVYMGWLKWALMVPGIVNAAGVRLPAQRIEKFKEHTWQARRWAWVDPLKDTQANVLAIQNGLTSRARVIRDSGEDPEKVWQELQEESEILKELLIDNLESSNGANEETDQQD